MFKSLIFSIAILLIMLSCNSAREKHVYTQEAITTNTTDPKKRLAEEFISLFNEIKINPKESFLVETTENQGSRILPKYDTLLNTQLTSKETHMESDGFIFAVAKINYVDSIDGLIIRHYGEYAPNRLSLFLWNNIKNEFVSQKGIELSIAYGDGNWSMRKSSIIKDYNNDGIFDIISRTVESENEIQSPSILVDTFKFLMFNNHQFIQNTTLNNGALSIWETSLPPNQISLIDSYLEVKGTELYNKGELFLSTKKITYKNQVIYSAANEENEEVHFSVAPLSLIGPILSYEIDAVEKTGVAYWQFNFTSINVNTLEPVSLLELVSEDDLLMSISNDGWVKNNFDKTTIQSVENLNDLLDILNQFDFISGLNEFSFSVLKYDKKSDNLHIRLIGTNTEGHHPMPFQLGLIVRPKASLKPYLINHNNFYLGEFKNGLK